MCLFSHQFYSHFAANEGDLRMEMPICNHTMMITDALHMLEIQKVRLQECKKKVLISIGATDLRNNNSFISMTQNIMDLFSKCDEYGMEPLITTVLCIDTPQLSSRADTFNKFLMENFHNVLDIQDVGPSNLDVLMERI